MNLDGWVCPLLQRVQDEVHVVDDKRDQEKDPHGRCLVPMFLDHGRRGPDVCVPGGGSNRFRTREVGGILKNEVGKAG